MWGTPKFDKHAFADRRAKAVSAKTHIAFGDFEKMHVHRRQVKPERKLPTPEWANSDEGLRRAMLRFCEAYLYIRNPVGTDADRLQMIRDKAKARLPNVETRLRIALAQYHQLQTTGKNFYNRTKDDGKRDFAISVQNIDRQVQILRRGMPELVTAVATYYYRLGWTSVEVAEELNRSADKQVATPAMIREWLYRMNWRAVGRKCHHWNGPRKEVTPWPAEMLRKLFVMRASGKTMKECASHFRVSATVILHRLKELDAVERFCTLRDSGLSFNQCAKLLGTGDLNA